ncbi:MAG: bifunctional serine/threonine-protein kinase/formylglycine-generating enzyme family protein [Myxococcota bacterium]
MNHPELDDLAPDDPPPEVVAHLLACVRCRFDRAAYRGDDGAFDCTLRTAVDPGRYRIRGWLGQGGMGTVLRVRDAQLDRDVAVKLLLPARGAGGAEGVDALLTEARIAASLAHAAIIPVHHSGTLCDGRPFYVMKIVAGRPLRAELAARDPIGTRRAVSLLQRVCEAIAYAHTAGIVHRDLKPENVVLGDFDELTIVDFGLSSTRGADVSRAGTASYLPPELVHGGRAQASADVYAIGVMLYEVLGGRLPYDGDTGEVLDQIEAGPPPALSGVDPALAGLCAAAMARHPAARISARALGDALRAWLDGEARLAEAREIVTRAAPLGRDADAARAEAEALRAQAHALLAQVPADAPPSAKEAAWAQQDAADEALARADALDLRYEHEIAAAIRRWPDLPEARTAQAEHWRQRLLDAEARRDPRDVARFTGLLRHNGALDAWLDAEIPLELRTDPPGLPAVARPYERVGRRLVLGAPRPLGATPLSTSLPPGSWRIELGGAGVPLWLARGAPSPTAGPGGEPVVHAVPAALPDDQCWVPAGWAVVGGDELAPDAFPRRRVWVDAFVVGRFPVTAGEYLAFLRALVDGDVERYLPRAPDSGAPRVLRDGGLALPDDVDPDTPVVLVDLASARAYAAWRAARDGLPWRLPTEIEREKAARGVDGRPWPWGDHFEPAWACTVSSAPEPRLAPVRAFPSDESVYGVRGLAGGVRDWTASAWTPEPPAEGSVARVVDETGEHQVVRGGAWTSTSALGRPASRFGGAPANRYWNTGFRLARSV